VKSNPACGFTSRTEVANTADKRLTHPNQMVTVFSNSGIPHSPTGTAKHIPLTASHSKNGPPCAHVCTPILRKRFTPAQLLAVVLTLERFLKRLSCFRIYVLTTMRGV
jgi:hypothetical protein